MEEPLPQEIIHGVQSFLDGKEAARTSILSKSWHSAWRTRPTLDFRRDHFGSDEQFLEFAEKTLKRYEQLNLNIAAFSLKYPNRDQGKEHHTPLVNELIAKAMELRAADLKIDLYDKSFVLADSVTRSKTLTTLTLTGCFKLPAPHIRSETLATLSVTGDFDVDVRDIACPKLKTLSLSTSAEAADIFRVLNSKFPLLERLKLYNRKYVPPRNGQTTKVSKPFVGVENGECEHHNLKYMHLEQFRVGAKLFSPTFFSTKFPFLKKLVIWNCKSLHNMRIRSESLESISIGGFESCDLDFHVPNLRRFQFEGYPPSSRLEFKRTAAAGRVLESADIHVTCKNPNREWFEALDGLLSTLSPISKAISLSITNPREEYCRSGFWLPVVVGFTKPHGVECLTLGVKGANDAFLDGVILLCRPKYIVHEDGEENGYIKDYLVQLVSSGILIKEVNEEEVLEERVSSHHHQLPWIDNCESNTRKLVRWRLQQRR